MNQPARITVPGSAPVAADGVDASPAGKDPQVLQYRFWQLHLTGDDESAPYLRWKEFRAVLNSAISWIGDRRAVRDFGDTAQRARRSTRLVARPDDWIQDGDNRKYLEARQLVDTAYLVLAESRPGTAGPEAFDPLFQGRFAFAEDGGSVLGEACCLVLEVAPPLRAQQAQALARRCLASVGHADAADLEVCSLGSCRLLLSSGRRDQPWVLLAEDSDEGRAQAGHLTLMVLPQLFFAWLKGWHEADVAEQSQPPKQVLATSSPVARPKGGSDGDSALRSLESRTFHLAASRPEYSDRARQLQETRHALAANIGNLEHLLEGPFLHSAQDTLDLLLVAGLRRELAQVDTDLAYYRTWIEDIDSRLHVLALTAGQRGNRWNRTMALLMGIFGAAGVGQLIAEPTTAVQMKLVIMGVAFVVLLFLAWLILREDLF
jgi:hypothetical protein